METSDSRLICIDLNIGDRNIRILNCYLPYDENDNIAEYVDYLAKIHCILEDHSNDYAITIGDFNAHPQSRFGNELANFCNEFHYCIGDVDVLPDDTYTWVSDATGHTRWLDHLVCRVSVSPDNRCLCRLPYYWF